MSKKIVSLLAVFIGMFLVSNSSTRFDMSDVSEIVLALPNVPIVYLPVSPLLVPIECSYLMMPH